MLAWGYEPPWVWGVASLGVLALALAQRRPVGAALFGRLLLGCLAIYLVHHAQPYGHAWGWIRTVTVALAAATFVSAEPAGTLRRWVLLAAWLQVPAMLWQALGHPSAWPSMGGGLTGTLGRRALCGGLVALASLWTTGRLAWTFALLGSLTGSFVILPAWGRLLWQSRWRSASLLLFALASVLASVGLWWPRLLVRLPLWQDAILFRGGWLTGWGFLPLPGGFAYDNGDGMHRARVLSDYHNALLDWLSRTGVLGWMLLVGTAVWVWRRRAHAQTRWTGALMLWVACWQSVEANTALGVLGLVWLVDLAQHKE